MFIVLEGIDGSGKTTLAKMLSERLSYKYKVFLTEEPTKTWVGKDVRRAIEEEKNPYTQALLFFADRAEHIDAMRKHLMRGYVVISDRYVYSTYAYQGAQLQGIMDFKSALQWFQWIYEPMRLDPDAVIYVDIEPEAGLRRIYGREKKEKFEKAEFLQRVREYYLKMAEEMGFVVLDGSQPVERVFSEMLEKLEEMGVITLD